MPEAVNNVDFYPPFYELCKEFNAINEKIMSSGLLIFLIAVGAVAFFVIGLSLTIIFKGHYMDSEIGDNQHMKEKGIQCASRQIRAEEAALRGEPMPDETCSSGGCSSCTTGECTEVHRKE